MDETMPDALPLTKRFLSSLARFLEHEHQPQGEGDISAQVRRAIAPPEAVTEQCLEEIAIAESLESSRQI